MSKSATVYELGLNPVRGTGSSRGLGGSRHRSRRHYREQKRVTAREGCQKGKCNLGPAVPGIHGTELRNT